MARYLEESSIYSKLNVDINYVMAEAHRGGEAAPGDGDSCSYSLLI